MEPRKIVGYRIREERTRRGISQGRLADIMNDLLGKKDKDKDRWYPQTVGAAEKGERAFTIDDLFLIRYALRVSLDHLTTPPPGEPVEVAGFTMEVPPDGDMVIETLLLDDVERAVQELRTYLDPRNPRRRGE
jgi:transcriptional regulator with XRE-family HTH domain